MPVVDAAGLPQSIRTARVVAVIPARYQSTRLPGKPLALIDGKPMIEHVCRRAELARTVDAVVVATDDERIARAVDGFGHVAVMTSASHATGTDRLAEVAAHLRCDVVVNIQGDEPLIDPESIDAAILPLLPGPKGPGLHLKEPRTFRSGESTDVISTLRRRIDDPADLTNPSVVKVVVDADGYALYFSRSPVPFVRDGAPTPLFWRHLGLYAYRRAFLLALARLPQTPLELSEQLEQLRVLEHGYRIRTVETTADTIGVDTPEDLERIRTFIS